MSQHEIQRSHSPARPAFDWCTWHWTREGGGPLLFGDLPLAVNAAALVGVPVRAQVMQSAGGLTFTWTDPDGV